MLLAHGTGSSAGKSLPFLGRQRTWRGKCRASGESTDGEDSPESLFEKELRKRGLAGGAVKADERDGKDSGSSRNQRPVQLPQFRGQGDGSNADQLERSRKLNSEGLEGLIPRATELAKLGGSFWVAFYPFIGLLIGAFIILYLASGSSFIHQGNSRMAVPEYLDRSLFMEQPDEQPLQPQLTEQSEAAPSDTVF